MKVFHGYKNAGGLKDPVAAIGIFDGIHIGHKKVIKRMLNCPGEGRDRVIITFDPHPRSVLYPKKPLPRIMSLDHRLRIFEKMGVDAVVIVNFTEVIAGMTPEEFIKRVISGLGARTVFVGSNFRFGNGKKGDVNVFAEISRKYGIETRIVPPVKRRGRIVSSTRVRELVAKSDIKEAEKLLRRPVSVLGTVVKGEEIGRRIGVPTANIDPHQEVIPPPGVYAVKVDVNGKLHDGVLNIGFRPTFYGNRAKRREEPKIEVHIYDFEEHLYGATLEIFFIQKLRNEKKFHNETALVAQIMADKARARKLLADPSIARKIRKYKFI